ncbi:MAG: ribosomal-processing cysteine protease Prp [Oscillospiraceae bacterium]|nr:ribosomal-processing cysteine protease Prp [Oscillospiraceae bacterium]
MIKAVFFRKNGRLSGFDISGHADYADSGTDIVCASVSSAAQLTANTITDFFCCNAQVAVDNNRLSLMLKNGEKDCDLSAEKLLESLYTHLEFISEDFPDTVDLRLKEG